VQRCPSVKSLKTELPSFLKCAVMLTVKCQEQTRHVVSEPKNCVEGGGGSGKYSGLSLLRSGIYIWRKLRLL